MTEKSLIDREQVLAILKKLLEQAEECAACGTEPTAQEALDWVIDEVTSVPITECLCAAPEAAQGL